MLYIKHWRSQIENKNGYESKKSQPDQWTNKMLFRAQLDTTAEVEPWTVGANMDTTFKLDTALN